MKNCNALFALMTFIGASIVFTVQLTPSDAKTQDRNRVVIKKPWRVEPVKIVAVKTNNKDNIETGRAFDGDNGWLDGLTLTVANNYNKNVTALSIELVFRREQGDTRPPLVYRLHFGPSPLSPTYLRRDLNKVIKVGKTTDLRLSPQNYESLKRQLEETGYLNGVKRVELVIREVGFEDGSMLDAGTFYLQDPASPGDPSKKIKVRDPADRQSQKNRSPQTVRTV